MRLVTADHMRAIEARAAERGVPEPELMERAGRAAADVAARMLGGAADRRVVVLVGPGNNGGDGLVAARHLDDAGARVRCALLVPRDDSDANFRALGERDIALLGTHDPALFDGADLVIDALLGTGRARPIEGELAALLGRLRAARASFRPPLLLALDLPTGVDADHGNVDPHTVAADRTVTFGFSKVGLHALPGATCAGEVEVADIGLPDEAAQGLAIDLVDAAWVRSVLPPRPLAANKGTFGRVVVAAGSLRYAGAAAMAAKAALRAGAGLVTLACPESVHRLLAGSLWESTFLPMPDQEGMLGTEAASALLREATDYDALLVGPGIAQSPDTRAFLRTLLEGLTPDLFRAAVIDADALNNLARVEGWSARLPLPCVLTPHPGEMARLLGCTVPEVQGDRLGVAAQAARAWGQVVVLKGANTVIAAPEGAPRLCAIATPALATAGTGDVLSGTIVSLIGQGMAPFDAAAAGAWVHGRAGQRVGERLGTRGAVAGDLLEELPHVFRELEASG